MYPQCRHVRTDSDRRHAAAIKGNHWCYFHARLHEQQAQQAKHIAQEAERRSRDASRQPRLAKGTFASSEETEESIIDQGIYPVKAADHREPATLNSHGSAYAETASLPLQLPAVEDSASIQLALIEVIHALAADQLDPVAPASSSTRSRSPRPTPKTSTSIPTASAPSATPKKASPSPPRNTAGT